MENSLEKRILATLIWHDGLNFPLTAFEIWQYLIKEKGARGDIPSLRAVEKTLQKSVFLRSKISSRRGFYFLKNREGLVESRIFQNKLSIKKWRRLREIIKLLSFIPYVRMIGVTGSMSFSHPRKESDLDVLIITARNRIWLTRFLVTLVTHLLGVRRHQQKTRSRICLNHYVSEERLKVAGKSLYTALEYLKMVPVFGKETYNKFIKENKWLADFLANPRTFQIQNKWLLKESKFQKISQKFFEICFDNPVGDLVEKFLGKAQEKRIKRDSLYRKPGGRVRVSRFQLEFHPDSPEKGILEEFNKKAVSFNLNEFANQKNSGLLK